MRHYLPLFILLGLYSAARRDAILTLRWPQIDFARGLIDLNPAGRVQTKKGRAKIPAPRRLLTFLRLAKRRGGDLGPVLHIDGRMIGSVKKSFAAACKRAGLAGVSPHTLRHTSATWMAQSGVDLWKIAGYLGQTVAATTERYAHHHPDYMQEAKAALDRHSVTNSVTK